MFYLWLATGALGLVLQVLLLRAMLLRQGHKEYPFLFAYACVLLVTSSVEAEAYLNGRPRGEAAFSYYWAADAVRQVLLYLVVLALWKRTRASRIASAAMWRTIAIGSVVYVALSLYFTHEPYIDLWMTLFSRNLGFLAVLLNLLLWAALMLKRSEDKVPLMISGGMGLQMAGKAIGHSLRYLSDRLVTTGDLVIVLSHLVCLAFWWQAFRVYAPARYRTRSNEVTGG